MRRGVVFISLKSDPNYQGREPVALASKFYLYGLSGLEIRQIAGFVSDPNGGFVGDPEPQIFLLF